MLKMLMHYACTLTTSHSLHSCDSEVDVGPQVWKCVLLQATITTSYSLSGVAANVHKVTKYIQLHCSYVDG